MCRIPRNVYVQCVQYSFKHHFKSKNSSHTWVDESGSQRKKEGNYTVIQRVQKKIITKITNFSAENGLQRS